jgi:hypothetical protein
MSRALAAVLVLALASIPVGADAQPATVGTPPPAATDADATALSRDLNAAAAGASSKQQWEVTVGSPPNDEGKKILVTWKRDSIYKGTRLVILRAEAPAKYVAGTDHRYVGSHQTPMLAPDFLFLTQPECPQDAKALDASTLSTDPGTAWGDWTVVAVKEEKDAKEGEQVDEVEPGHRYIYALAPAIILEDKPGVAAFIGEAVITPPRGPAAAWFDRSRWFFLLFIALTGVSFLLYIEIAKRRGKEMFIRRIPGVDAIEDAVGRSTEMGRPVLYVTGIEEITDIQTIASLLILGHVAEMTAEYDTEIKVCNTYPMTMIVAEEIVRNSYTNVGRADAHRPENIMFITSEQFAFAAAVNGMILRDRPATNIYLGRFFAESLILSETGFMAGAVQIAGTAEFTQLPFFVAACDYTLIGEELYATGAYLSREPNQIAQIKAGDVMKVLVTALILAGVIAATLQDVNLIGKFIP